MVGGTYPGSMEAIYHPGSMEGYTPPGISWSIHPGYTIPCTPPTLGVSVAPTGVAEHDPGLNSEINNEERPPCAFKPLFPVNIGRRFCAELFRSSR